MNNPQSTINFQKIADLSERIAKLSPARYQLLERLLQAEGSNQACLPVVTGGEKSSSAELLYALEWRPLSLEGGAASRQPSQPGYWLIFADLRSGVGQALAERWESQGERCIQVVPGPAYERISDRKYAINPLALGDCQRLLSEIAETCQLPCRGIVHLWSLEVGGSNPSLTALQEAQVRGCGSVLHLVQSLIQSPWTQLPRLWLVTRGAVATNATNGATEPLQVAQAPLWGLGRTIALEHPELQCTCLDWGTAGEGEELAALDRELNAASEETQVAWRRGIRSVARLVPYPPPHPPCPLSPSSLLGEGSYLIAGGLGDLGLKVANWLVERGARHLLLTGRRGPSPAAQSAIQQLEESGAQVSVVTADLANPDDVTRLLATGQSSLPPLLGIIQAAGILDDGTMAALSWERFDRVLAAKVAGTWNLHQQTRDLPLDFFVCFSSISSLLGNAGQGNYAAANAFLDALAHHRRALGLPGLTVNWGPWAEVGMAARLDGQTPHRMAARGLGYLAPAQGLQILGELLGQSNPQVGVMSISWPEFLSQFATGTPPPLLSDPEGRRSLFAQRSQPPTSGQESGAAAPAVLKGQLPQVSALEGQRLLVSYLQGLVTKFLGLSQSAPPKPSQALGELGLDSLVSIQLRNRIRAELEINLPLSSLQGEATIAQLSEAIYRQAVLENLSPSEGTTTDRRRRVEDSLSEDSLSEDMEEIRL